MYSYKSKRPDHNFLYNKVVSSHKNKKLDRKEFEFIYDLILSHDEIKSLFPNASKFSIVITFLDSNLIYDIYSLRYGKDVYVFKISYLASENSLLEKEFKILNEISSLDIAPTPIYHGIRNGIEILFVSFLSGSSINFLGLRPLLNNSFSVGQNLGKLHLGSQSDISESGEFLSFYKNMADFKNNLGDEVYNEMSKNSNFLRLSETIALLLSKFEEEYESLPKYGFNALCHSNLQPSSVLLNSESIKFINFYSSFKMDVLADLAISSINFGYSQYKDKQIEFIKGYQDSFSEITYEYLASIMPAYRNTFYKVMLVKIICLFYYEIIIHGYKRSNKFVNIINAYEKMRSLIMSDGLVNNIRLENTLYIFN